MINKLYILLFLLLPVYNYSQVNCDIIFEDSPPSSTNNTIAIQSADVGIGDQIGVFYIDDFGQYVCSSTITWTGEVDALVGFGDDSFTSEIDGFFNGDEMLFFSSSTDGTIYELLPIFDENAPFSSTWQSNGFTNVLSLSVSDFIECADEEILGCIDSTACNYNENATNDDGSCTYVDGICETCENGIIIDNDADNDGICNDDEIVQVNGCTEENAFNFDSSATNDDGSCCFVNGCSQSDNILYNPNACFFDDNLCLSINDCPDVTIIPFTNINNVSCFNESDGSIEVIFGSTFGGIPPYNVFWDQLIDTDGDGIDDSEINVFDPNNDGVLENLTASNYRVSIVDNSGCTGSTIVSVTQPAEININYDFSEILCSSDESTISVGIEGSIMNYDVSVNGEFIETVFAGSPTITTEDDFDFTQTGSNNTIVIFGCDDSDCSDINGIINPGDIIGIFYENVNGDLECGGSATFNGTIPFASLSGWQTEFAQDNGFEDGDPYIWYLFDTSGDIYQLIPNYDLSQGLDYFTPGGFTVVSSFEIGTILGSNDDFYYNVSSGEYLIEVIAENGCSSSTTINISEPNQLQIDNFNVVNPTCNGSQDGYINIELIGGTGELSYSWIGPFGELISSDQNIYNLFPGNYTVTITDGNDCLISQTYEIIDPQNIDILYSYDPIICNGDNTVLTLDISGGVSPYTIDYNGEDPDNISSGFYTFSVTDSSGCLETFDVSINNPDGIAISFPTVETVCYGETNIPVDFSMSVSGGNPPYSYEWFEENGLSLGIFSPSSTVSPGNYSIIITDSENCVSVPSYFTISEPEQINVDFDLEDINCFGETATANFTIDGSPGSYTIFFNDIEETTTIGLSDVSFDWTNTGVNASIVISEITGLDLNNGDLIGVFYTSSNGVQCGGTTIYDENSGFPISLAAWGEETGQDNGFVNGEEFLFLINSGGLVYEVDVSFNLSVPGFTDVFEINGLSQIENMNVTGVFSDGPDFSFDNLEQNSYLVEIVDGNGCAWDSTIVVSGANELFVSNEILSAASCFGDLAEISSSISGGVPPYTFEWQNINTGELISIQPEPQLPSGTFLFTVYDSNGCSEINVFEVPQESGQVNITTQDEQCSNENDGYIEACVNWENTITYSLTNLNGTTQEFTTEGDGVETCYIFNNLSPDTYNLEVLSFDGCVVSEQINIIPADPILVAFDTSPANCFDYPSGTIVIQEIFGGNPPFEIDWNGVDTEAVLPGFHSFVITDENGCSKTYNYSISSPAEINTSAIINQNNCYNSSSGSIILSVNGGVPNYNYLWTNSEGTVISFDSNISNLPSDTYTVEITDSNGCVYIEDYTILDENDDFIFTVNSTPADCFAGFGTASANVLNEDNLLYDFNWPNGIINNGEEVFLPAGDYQLIVVNTITGCEKSQLFSVFEPEEFIIQVDFDPILCFEDLNNDGVNDITTSVNSIVFGGADFDIDGDGINNNIDNDIDNDGVVNILDDDIDGDGILNEFDDDDLIWIDGDVDKDGIVNDEDTDWDGVEVFVDKDFLNPGIYFVYTFDSNGCYTITEFEITSPEELLIDASPNQILCFGEYGSSDLNISGGVAPYEIIWFNTLSGDEVDPSALLGGDLGISYTVEVTDQNGCFEFDTFVIDPEPEEITLIDYTSNYNDFEVSCFNYSDGWIDLDVSGGTPPYSYSWLGPNGQIYNDQDIYNLSSGLYSINITDSNGCQLNSSFEPYTIYMEEPDDFKILFSWTENTYCEESNDGIISITTNGGVPNFNYTINNLSEINEGGSFLTNLDIDNLNIENENSIVIENLEAGFYSINILSDQNNCISPQIIDLEVGFDEENCLFIPTIFTPNSDGLNDTFDIYGIEYYPEASVFIYDRWGVKKFESKNNTYVPWDGLTDGVENEIGTYYYVIELNTGQKKYSGSITLKR